MKKQFELKNWMSENREVVIAKFEALKSEKFYNGITLKNFMLEVLSAMQMNNVRSEKRAKEMLPFLMSNVYVNNSKIGVTYSTPYVESNHAKAVNYHGGEKVKMMSSAK
jgi:hypothetical protein